MALQNIGASNKDDAFYRYKMPKMLTKIEGRGNGIKTNVVNMVDIAKALGRPASLTIKYFGIELGAQTKFDEKTGSSHVNGAHETAKLAGLLENFIKKYVQCYGCGNPETEIVITKTKMITLKCAACGFLSDVDMRDKLTDHILKHPPEQKKGSKDKKAMRRVEKERLKEGEAADEEMKKLKKEANKKKGSSSSLKDLGKSKTSKKKHNSSDEDHSPPHSHADDSDRLTADEDEEDDDVQWQTDTSLAAAQQRIQEQLNSVTADMVMLTTTEEKPKSGKNSPHLETKPHQNGNNGSSRQEQLVQELKEHLKKGDSAKEFKSYLNSHSGTSEELMNALIVALFDKVVKGFTKEVTKNLMYLAAATPDERSQMLLLYAIESFFKNQSSEAMTEVAFVLKELYENDVLAEECIINWYEKGIASTDKNLLVWKKAKPVVDWLKTAESESEEE